MPPNEGYMLKVTGPLETFYS